MILLDTCALIELTKQSPSFSPKVYNAIRENCCILSISFAEIHCKIKAGKLSLGTKNAHDLYDEIKKIENMTMISDISPAHWFSTIDLTWVNPKNKDHKDPADRLILSYALSRNLPIATTDQMMHTLYDKCCW